MKRIIGLVALAVFVLLASCTAVGLPKVVKVGRTDCLPCKDMSAILGVVKEEISGKAKVEIVNLEDEPNAIQKYNIKGIPTTMFFDKKGKEVYRQIGIVPKEEVIDWLKKAGMQ